MPAEWPASRVGTSSDRSSGPNSGGQIASEDFSRLLGLSNFLRRSFWPGTGIIIEERYLDDLVKSNLCVTHRNLNPFYNRTLLTAHTSSRQKTNPSPASSPLLSTPSRRRRGSGRPSRRSSKTTTIGGTPPGRRTPTRTTGTSEPPCRQPQSPPPPLPSPMPTIRAYVSLAASVDAIDLDDVAGGVGSKMEVDG